ncbi:MAG: hypothetical protein ACK2TT_11445, partial [Anaerolineales bacterium]
MTEFTEQPQVIKEIPQETKEVAEAKQELDRATLEPASAVEKAVDVKIAEAVEAAVKEAVSAASVATEHRGPRTEDHTVETDTSSGVDGGRETGERGIEVDTFTDYVGQETEKRMEDAPSPTYHREVEQPHIMGSDSQDATTEGPEQSDQSTTEQTNASQEDTSLPGETDQPTDESAGTEGAIDPEIRNDEREADQPIIIGADAQDATTEGPEQSDQSTAEQNNTNQEDSQKTNPTTLAKGLSRLVGEEEGGPDRSSSENSVDNVQDSGLNIAPDAAMSAGDLAVPYIPGGSVLVSAMDSLNQLKESTGD